MSDAQPSRFSDLSASRAARLWEHVKEWNERLGVVDFFVSLAIAATIVFMSRSDATLFKAPLLKEGQVANVTIRSPRNLDIEDANASETERARILEKIPEVYDYDSAMLQSSIEKWKSTMRHFRQTRDSTVNLEALSTRLGIPLSLEEFTLLKQMNFSPDLERSISYSFAPLWDFKIVQKRIPSSNAIEMVDIRTSKNTLLPGVDASQMISVGEVTGLVGRGVKNSTKTRLNVVRVPWEKWRPELRSKIFEIQSRLISPNVTLNRKESELRREAALKDFHPSFRRFEKGEVIVREGERVSKRDAQLLLGLRQRQSATGRDDSQWPQILFGAFFLWLICFSIRKQFPSVLKSGKDALVASGMLVFSLAALKLALIFQLSVLPESLTSVPEFFLLFLIPVAAPAMTLRLLVGVPLTLLFSVIHSVAVGLMVGKAALFGAYVLASCLMGAQFLGRCRTRSQLYRAGVGTAIVCGFGALLLVGAWNGQLPFSGVESDAAGQSLSFMSLMLWTFAGGLIGGWLSSALTLVMVPIYESLLDYTTDLKLLELARMDHPLLRDLVLKAPGTYHHSIIVGSLVEAGAEAIGANALLARVGAYYHDIGKVGRAEYFVENQGGGINPHDNTKPQLSAKIIISHVKEGIQLAESYKLGRNLIEFIETHHGRGVVSFFYNKAKQDAAQPGSTVNPDDISEDDFRYPGPKPRTKECAILSLADACEAATRSLVDPTPARLEGMVNKIFMKGFTEGLLEEADITQEELHLVGKAFLRILLGIHHNRIQYPDQEKGLPPKPMTLLKASNK